MKKQIDPEQALQDASEVFAIGLTFGDGNGKAIVPALPNPSDEYVDIRDSKWWVATLQTTQDTKALSKGYDGFSNVDAATDFVALLRTWANEPEDDLEERGFSWKAGADTDVWSAVIFNEKLEPHSVYILRHPTGQNLSDFAVQYEQRLKSRFLIDVLDWTPTIVKAIVAYRKQSESDKTPKRAVKVIAKATVAKKAPAKAEPPKAVSRLEKLRAAKKGGGVVGASNGIDRNAVKDRLAARRVARASK